MRIIGKILGINSSDGGINILVADEHQTQFNIKTTNGEGFIVGRIYAFEVTKVIAERVSYQLDSFISVEGLEPTESDTILRSFLAGSPVSYQEAKQFIYSIVEELKNPVIRNITKGVLDKFSDKFFLYPAATKMHHAYVGGLAYHALGMLKLAEAFIINYPYLNRDYLMAGIILHDIGKTIELTGIQGTEYTLDGQLLGHLVIGALEISKMAEGLGYGNRPEVKMLEHMLISHHGQPQFGAAKRPITPEAIALWYIDTIDSKFRVLGEELQKTAPNSFTDTIGVLDKAKVYKE